MLFLVGGWCKKKKKKTQGPLLSGTTPYQTKLVQSTISNEVHAEPKMYNFNNNASTSTTTAPMKQYIVVELPGTNLKDDFLSHEKDEPISPRTQEDQGEKYYPKTRSCFNHLFYFVLFLYIKIENCTRQVFFWFCFDFKQKSLFFISVLYKIVLFSNIVSVL
ncbi:hypothetical protein RFI_22418 [Reticulomyxa filosa]|uniref:Uncharacterized protein n=1 Tax=Reticulomyxa filosa TaxID=46433 RepID=X6MNG0_RETFI|nr:hypothetical protein RFI_22418 [Reticulomyxa filosa]|eukprot:ETO14952.1 hypothetical protein RFI_22418 [Reticulomyxa filosa]